jgi:hypothetical protein
MAQYDQNDFTQRLLQLFPLPWTSDSARRPGGYLYALFYALAQPFATLYALLAYVLLQTRIATATDINLDLISQDFFGSELPRLALESDTSYRARILNTLLNGGMTRPGMALTLSNLGLDYDIVEDGNDGDIFALNTNNGLNLTGALGAAGRANSASCIQISTPLPNGLTQSEVLAAINAAKAEGAIVNVAFVAGPVPAPVV